LRVVGDLAEISKQLFQSALVETFREKQVAWFKSPTLAIAKVEDLTLGALAGHLQILPAALVAQPADEIVLMQPLVDHNHRALGWLVEPSHERTLEPVMNSVSRHIGLG
jgi:hypothetical protein